MGIVRTILILCLLVVVGSVALLLFATVSEWRVGLFFGKVGIIAGAVASLAIGGSLRFLGEDRTNALVSNVLVLLTSLVFLMIASEFAMRLIFRNITTTGDNRSYFAEKWKKKNVRLNSRGFREIEFDLAKPDDMYRIAVVGDSITFGQGVLENDRFSNLIKSYLANEGHYQVLNFGKCGAETIDHLKFLQDVVVKAQPDFVVLQWFPNDFEGSNKTGRPRYLSLLPSKTLCRMLRRRSALYYVLTHQWRTLQIRSGYCDTYASYMDKRFSDPQSCDSKGAMAALTEFIEECHNRDIDVGFFLYPDTGFDLGNSYPFGYLHERVRELCHKKEVTCLDLRNTFARNSARTEYWVNRFDRHPNTLANRLIADRLIEAFAPIWLSDRTQSGKIAEVLRRSPLQN